MEIQTWLFGNSVMPAWDCMDITKSPEDFESFDRFCDNIDSLCEQFGWNGMGPCEADAPDCIQTYSIKRSDPRLKEWYEAQLKGYGYEPNS